MPHRKQLAATVPYPDMIQKYKRKQSSSFDDIYDNRIAGFTHSESDQDIVIKEKKNLNGCFAFIEFIMEMITLWFKQKKRLSQVSVVINDS